MTGVSRSTSVVIAYLMKHRGWPYAQSLSWVRDRRPCINLTPVAHAQLLEYELACFGKNFEFNSVDSLHGQQQSGAAAITPTLSPFGLVPATTSNFPSAPSCSESPCSFTFGSVSMTESPSTASAPFSTPSFFGTSFSGGPTQVSPTQPFVFGSPNGVSKAPADETMDMQ